MRGYMQLSKYTHTRAHCTEGVTRSDGPERANGDGDGTGDGNGNGGGDERTKSHPTGRGGGYRKFLPVLVGNGTKIAPPGDIFKQPLDRIS